MRHPVTVTRTPVNGKIKAEPKSNRTVGAHSLASSTAGRANQARSFRFSPFFKWYQDSWVLEYLSLVLSILSLIAIFAIVLHFDNKASKTWHSKLSLNAVLSILATVLKGVTLLATASALGQSKWAWYCRSARSLQDFQTFDSASRGPFGALFLLWQLPRSTLACLGSLIIIIGLASDASIQASTSQPLRSLFSSTASVPVGSNYDGPIGVGIVDPLLVNALYTGVFNAEVVINNNMANNTPGGILNTTSYSISPFCGTGNCTFEPYASLAINHRCLDITELLQYADGSNATLQNVTLSISPDSLLITARERYRI